MNLPNRQIIQNPEKFDSWAQYLMVIVQAVINALRKKSSVITEEDVTQYMADYGGDITREQAKQDLLRLIPNNGATVGSYSLLREAGLCFLNFWAKGSKPTKAEPSIDKIPYISEKDENGKSVFTEFGPEFWLIPLTPHDPKIKGIMQETHPTMQLDNPKKVIYPNVFEYAPRTSVGLTEPNVWGGVIQYKLCAVIAQLNGQWNLFGPCLIPLATSLIMQGKDYWFASVKTIFKGRVPMKLSVAPLKTKFSLVQRDPKAKRINAEMKYSCTTNYVDLATTLQQAVELTKLATDMSLIPIYKAETTSSSPIEDTDTDTQQESEISNEPPF